MDTRLDALEVSVDVAISFAELAVPSWLLRDLDGRFLQFERTARRRIGVAAADLDALRAPSTLGGRFHLDLHPDFPCLEWFDGTERPRTSRSDAGWRIWRPPLDLLPAADRAHLERLGLSDAGRSPPLVARHHPDRGSRDPTGRELSRVGAAIDEATDHLVDRLRPDC